jgi:predicted transglutaminase-like cysteine proteinase
VRNADHALLIVRVGDEFVALDNTTDKLLDAALAHDYTPVLSFGSTAKWVHGY